jgi:hypothetical protein
MRKSVKIDRSASTHYPSVGYMLRKEDIKAMIEDDSIKNQHFLIQLLADSILAEAVNAKQ